MKKLTTEEFIKKAREIHGDKYDYSKVEYINNSTKVCIICPEHGEFWQLPSNHIHGTHPQGCPKCNAERPSPRKLTTEDFISRAKEVHGDKYDYSNVEYVNYRTKVCIICPKHGEFWQEPANHLSSQGCPKCKIDKITSVNKTTQEEFIRRAKEVHGDKYNYSKVEYINNSTKVCIICPEHGEFWQTPRKHLMGSGCSKCNGGKPFTTEEFIKEAREVHGDKYDYSKVEYVNSKTKVCIICPEHGEFWQKPSIHLMGCGCPRCTKKNVFTTEDFIKKAREVHGDKYNYSKVEYKGSHTKVCIICPEHGEFWQEPSNHLYGYGCPNCKFDKLSNLYKSTVDEFIRKACEVHGDKYDYSKVEYINGKTKVCIICPEHGEFWQEPNSHLSGSGCPICNHGYTKQYKFNLLQEFENEYSFKSFLENNDVNILYVILRNIEPKYEPLKRDIEKALAHSTEVDPIKALRDKYTSDSEDELDEDEEEVENETEDFEITTAPSIDLDDDDAIDSMVTTETTKEVDAPTIEDIVKNTQREIKVINKIEHMLTPEDREYIMNKFLNDKRRIWMAARENRK